MPLEPLKAWTEEDRSLYQVRTSVYLGHSASWGVTSCSDCQHRSKRWSACVRVCLCYRLIRVYVCIDQESVKGEGESCLQESKVHRLTVQECNWSLMCTTYTHTHTHTHARFEKKHSDVCITCSLLCYETGKKNLVWRTDRGRGENEWDEFLGHVAVVGRLIRTVCGSDGEKEKAAPLWMLPQEEK